MLCDAGLANQTVRQTFSLLNDPSPIWLKKRTISSFTINGLDGCGVAARCDENVFEATASQSVHWSDSE